MDFVYVISHAHITGGGELVVSILSFIASLLGEYTSPERWSAHGWLISRWDLFCLRSVMYWMKNVWDSVILWVFGWALGGPLALTQTTTTWEPSLGLVGGMFQRKEAPIKKLWSSYYQLKCVMVNNVFIK